MIRTRHHRFNKSGTSNLFPTLYVNFVLVKLDEGFVGEFESSGLTFDGYLVLSRGRRQAPELNRSISVLYSYSYS